MTQIETPNIGIIEGFYGKQWPHSDRIAIAPHFANIGIKSYIYAPKSDFSLRKEWREAFSLDQKKKLIQLSETYKTHNIDFGIGFSPMEIWEDWGPQAEQALTLKLKEILSVNPSTLCILLDDMQGHSPNLAKTQGEIMNLICDIAKDVKLIFCPTYYSDDPILDTVFGPRPVDYLSEIGELIDKRVNIFWTGPKVISHSMPDQHLEQVSKQLQRKPLIWDNIYSNDGRRSSNYLHLQQPDSYTPPNTQKTAGIIYNPMNQIWLSKHILSQTHPCCNAREKQNQMHPNLLKFLQTHIHEFQTLGLSELSESFIGLTKKQLIEMPPCDEVTEIIKWLSGDYTFDPNCLTD